MIKEFVEFVDSVKKMRDAQKGFFSSDKNSSARSTYLQVSRTYEKIVDDKIKEFNVDQTKLF